MGLIITDGERAKLSSKMKLWRSDWNVFAHDVLNLRLADWQQEGLNLIQHNKRTSFCSCTSAGKDHLGATASWCFLLLTPKLDANGILQTSLVINTAPSASQVETIMMGELKSRFAGSKLPKYVDAGIWNLRIRNDGVIFSIPENMKGKKKFGNYEKWRLHAFKGDQYNTERWTGFHNDNIMIVVTEASGIPPLIFSGIEGCLQNNSRLVLLHNPNNSQGEAYNSVKDSQYKFRRISAFDLDNFKLGDQLQKGEITQNEYDKLRFPGQTDYEWVKSHVEKQGWTIRIDQSEFDYAKHDFEFEGKCYRPSDVCKIKILAQHPESSEDTLIPLSWIEAAQDRWIEAKRPESKGIRGVDVAGMGNDTTVFCDRYGDYVDNFQTVAYMSKETVHMETAGKIKIEEKKFNYILIDSIGEGAGVYSRLRELKIYKTISFKNSYGAKGLKDKTGARKFLNMRAYTHWSLRDWLDPQFGSEAMLPPDDEMKAQLTEIKYIIKSNGVIQIESKEELKKRLGVSPDKSDTLAQTFAPIARLKVDSGNNPPISSSNILF